MPAWYRRCSRALHALFHAGAMDREMDDEMRLHLQMETEELIAMAGLSREEARRRALIAFGGVERYREEHRDARGMTWIEHRMQDLRYAVRGLRNRPGFALAVVLTLALGIGANAAMFSIVDRLLFRAPPMMRDAARVHRVFLQSARSAYSGARTSREAMPYRRFVDLTRDTRSFARTAEVATMHMAVGLGADAREMTVGMVSSAFFGLFDAPPALGRYFSASEDAPPRGASVVVLGYGLWDTRYGRDRHVLGHTLQIGAARYTIIGVAPRGFAGIWPDTPPAAFVPVTTFGAANGMEAMLDTYDWIFASMVVERREGVTVAAADADLTRAFRRSYATQRALHPGMPSIAVANPRAFVAPILIDQGPDESSVAKVATWLGGVALIVWLIACANVANLLLASALRRRQEVAVRLALGVSRVRLAGQLFTESLVLAFVGGAVGLAIAQWGGAVLRTTFLSTTSTATVITDSRSLVYAGAAALAAGLLTAFAPLAQARHADLTRDLREGAREGTYQRSRLRAALLVFQAALSVVLLVGAGLFVRSLQHVRAVPLGFEPRHVLAIGLTMRGVELDSARKVALFQSLERRARSLPGATGVARQDAIPFQGFMAAALRLPGVDSVSRPFTFHLNAVSPGYFATMGTAILKGRAIEPRDAADAPGAMVVSEAMASRLWPHEDALGRCVYVGAGTHCTYVVGVAENIKSMNLSDNAGLDYYLSSAQFAPREGGLVVRVRGDAAAAAQSVRTALQTVMPGAAYVTATPLSDLVGQQMRTWRLGATTIADFGLLALAVAAVGLYSVIAFNVGQRRHELGVRVALGAQAADVVRMVVAGGMKLAAAGITLGIAIALVLGRWIAPLLFEESPRDPGVLGLVAAVLLAVAALASFVPARRAARVEPMRALRTE